MITIKKGGIFRKIDEKNLSTYKERGYAVVEQATKKGKEAAEQKAGAKNGSNGK